MFTNLWRALANSVSASKPHRARRPAVQMRRLAVEPLESRVVLSGDFFLVPIGSGSTTSVNFEWTTRHASYNNEIGVYVVDDTSGKIGSLTPGSAGYLEAAVARAQTVFTSGQGAGAQKTLTFNAGSYLAFYIVQNGSLAAAMSALQTGGAGPKVFVSVDGVNSDGFDHVRNQFRGEGVRAYFEDMTGGGDRDFDDAVITIGHAGVITAPSTTQNVVPTTATLVARRAVNHNEVGYILADDALGTINGIAPGAAGYEAAAMQSSQRHVLFAPNDPVGTVRSFDLTGGKHLVLYLVQDDSSEDFLSRLLAGKSTPRVFFSIPAANSDHTDHALWFSAEQIGFEDMTGGGDHDYDDALINLSFGTPRLIDSVAPTVTAQLKNDTADANRTATATDKITSDPTISGTASDNVGVTKLKAGFDGTATADFVDVSSALQTGGAFEITASQINTIYGLGLTSGLHTLKLQAFDASGNASAVFQYQFTYDPTNTSSLLLDAASDTGVQGESRTDTASVTLVGQTEASASVRLVSVAAGGAETQIATGSADANGDYSFSNVSLAAGPNGFRVYATDAAGNVGESGLTLTLNRAPTVAAAIGTVNVDQDAADSTFDLSTVFADADNVNRIARISTSLGTIDVQLFDSRTPGHATNFATYANDNTYDNTIIHRLISGFIAQGGGYEYVAGANPNLVAVTTNAAVTNEPGLPNSQGTLALAKVSGDANSGTSQWFFNLGDNVANLDNQNGGFTVFGQVVGNGGQVLAAIAAVPTQNFSGAYTNIPLRNSFSGSDLQSATADNFVVVNDVTILSNPITYSVVSNNNTALVTATITNNELRLAYVAGQNGTAEITIRATDLDGTSTDHTFTVNVAAPTSD